MNGDLMPIGAHRRKPDPARRKKIIEGSKRADKIREQANKHHQEKDVPAAEAQLLEDLDRLEF